MKISTVIPTYNNATWLARCLQAVLSQSAPACEVVVLDDCSTDDTADVVAYFAVQCPRGFLRSIRYAEKSANWLQSMYAACEGLKGDWIHSVAADDYILAGFYETAAKSLTAHGPAGYVFADCYLRPEDAAFFQRVQQASGRVLPAEELLGRLQRGTMLGGSASLVRKDLFSFLNRKEIWRAGGFNDSIGYALLAARHGALELLAPFGVVSQGYSHQADGMRNSPDYRQECLAAIDRFLHDPEVSEGLEPFADTLMRFAVGTLNNFAAQAAERKPGGRDD